MSHFRTLALRRTLRAATLDRLQRWLCDAAQPSNPDAAMICEADLPAPRVPAQHLTLAVFSQCSVVVYGLPRGSEAIAGDIEGDIESYDVLLAFDRRTVEAFCLEASSEEWCGALPDELRAHALRLLQSGTHSPYWLQSMLLDLITAWEAVGDRPPVHSSVEVAEVGRAEFVDFAESGRFANSGNSADLALMDILHDMVQRARPVLQADRLALCQFSRADTVRSRLDAGGLVVCEAIASPEIRSLRASACPLHALFPMWMRHEPLAVEGGSEMRDVGDGAVDGAIDWAINDVTRDSRLSEVERQVLQNLHVRAQAVVPLWLHGQLWGALLAQTCLQERIWSAGDRDFLRYAAADLSLAIRQAQAVVELQQQKYTIEQTAERQSHQLNEALRTTQAARQTRTEFLSMMSHELRTPLACVIGMSSTLLRWPSFGDLNDKQREYLQTIYNSGEHLRELIDDLLDLAELESGATQLNMAEFSLSQLARHIVRIALDRATINGIQLDLELEIPKELDPFRADRARVNQILFNLLGNAIKFTLTGGRVVLRVVRSDRQVAFAVEDTGIGIPESKQALLFESFRQGDGTYTREYGGSGLGLALTKQLVDLHRGTIEVKSELNVGSCFTVLLPEAETPPSPATPVPSAAIAHIPQGHVVLVTSQEDDADLICEVLTAAGLQVVWMLDGSTALEQIWVLRPIVAIIDRHLDGIDGLELTSILRHSHEMEALQIVMMGNSGQPDDEVLCLRSGANRYVATPLNLEQLLTQVIELIGVAGAELAAAPLERIEG